MIRRNFIFIYVLFGIIAVQGHAYAWWSNSFSSRTTHERLTQDTILGDINEKEYPDIFLFRTEIIAGSNDETAHNTDTHGQMWAPDPDKWKDKYLKAFATKNYKDAYKIIGYQAHLTQDSQVPAHQKKCAHGFTWKFVYNHLDGCEKSADGSYGFSNGASAWEFQEGGFGWRYWRSDQEDDDNDNQIEDGLERNYSDLEIDGPSIYREYGSTWGTYGWGVENSRIDLLPGNDEGVDYFAEHPDSNITHQQLYKARAATRPVLEAASKSLPPLIKDVKFLGKSKKIKDIEYFFVGPQKGCVIDFNCLENRVRDVHMTIKIKEGEAPINTPRGLWQDKTVQLKRSPTELPWGDEIMILWKGETQGSKAKEGKYHLELEAADGDKNISPKDAGNWDIPVIIDTKAPRVSISGVENGAKYKKAVTAKAVVLDSYLDIDSLANSGWKIVKKSERKTKDGLEYTRVDLERKFSGPGKFNVVLKALDLAGNEGKNDPLSFEIDVKKNDNPDDNDDTSSAPVIIGDDAMGPDENVPEALPLPASPYKGEEPSPIAILDSGFSDEMMHLLGTINKPFDLVDPLAGTEEFYPHKVLIIPTDGLGMEADNPFWRGKLELFCQKGGIVICYGQQSGRAYQLLPGQPKGFGWSEDKACWYGSSYFQEPIHPIFAGQKDNLLDVYTDGYFTTWPSDAQILIYRAKNNLPVAMVYPFGAGKVVATALYPDWGSANGQYSLEEKMLFKNLITWALNPDDPALKVEPEKIARSPAVSTDFLAWINSDAEEVPKGTTVSFTFHIKNIADQPRRFFVNYFLPHNAAINHDPVYFLEFFGGQLIHTF